MGGVSINRTRVAFASQILMEESFLTFCCCFCEGKKDENTCIFFCFFIKVFSFLFLIIDQSLYLNGHSSRHVFIKATALRVLTATERLKHLRRSLFALAEEKKNSEKQLLDWTLLDTC